MSKKRLFLIIFVILSALAIQFEIVRYYTMEYCQQIIDQKTLENPDIDFTDRLILNFDKMTVFNLKTIILSLIPYFGSLVAALFLFRSSFNVLISFGLSLLVGIVLMQLLFFRHAPFEIFGTMSLNVLLSMIFFILSFYAIQRKNAYLASLTVFIGLLLWHYSYFFYSSIQEMETLSFFWVGLKVSSILLFTVIIFILLCPLKSKKSVENTP